MTTSTKRLFCFRCFIILYSLITVIEGKTFTSKPAVETSSRAWNQFHVAPDSTTLRLTTSPGDGSPRQPDVDGKTPSDVGHSRSIRKTRQVDPLHSCIEAKCSSWRSTEYLNCIYHHCISGLESSSSRFGRDIAGKMYRMGEGSQAERIASWKRQLGNRLVQGKTQMGLGRILPGKIRLGRQVERIVPGMKRRVPLGDPEAEPLVPVVASVPGAFLSMDLPLSRRGFNDISDVCKERNCGPYQQTVEYFNCIENIVDCPSLRR